MSSWVIPNKQSIKLWVFAIAGALWLSLLGAVVFNWHIVQAAPDNNGGGSDKRGIVTAMPANGPIGTWVIGGLSFSVNGATEIKNQLQVGSCAKVKYQVNGPINRALEIEGLSLSDCNQQTPGTPEATETPESHGTIPPTPDDNHGNHGKEPHGRINSLPANPALLGTWVISGTSYVVTTTTELRQKFGPFTINACVQVKSNNATPPVALRIETKQDFVCASDEDHGGDDDGGHHGMPGVTHGELFGIVKSFPANLIGGWQIGGMNFVADSTTEFNQEHGSFAISSTVEVKFYIDANGINHATKIENKFVNDHNGHDDDGNGIHEGAEGQAFGLLTSFPTGTVGVWIIGGIEYTVTNQTELKTKHGAFAINGQVKVEYFLDSQQHRIAHEVETTFNNGGVSANSNALLIGFVQAMPTDGFTGTWQISGITFTVDLSSTVKEEHGLVAVGSFVSVEYTVSNGINLVYKLATLVPPGCGEHTHSGKIERMDDGLAAASVTANAVWRIGGQDYVVTPATSLNDTLAPLAVNQTAVVNSYTAADGSLVATQIQGVTFNTQVFMPMVRR
jgi:hypothetical protein